MSSPRFFRNMNMTNIRLSPNDFHDMPDCYKSWAERARDCWISPGKPGKFSISEYRKWILSRPAKKGNTTLPGKELVAVYSEYGDTTKSYDPFEAHELFLDFAAVGKDPISVFNSDMAIQFVLKYGLPRFPTREPDFTLHYPLLAFYYEAREAYLILRLYESLISDDLHGIAKYLLTYEQEFASLKEKTLYTPDRDWFDLMYYNTFAERGRGNPIIDKFYTLQNQFNTLHKEHYRPACDGGKGYETIEYKNLADKLQKEQFNIWVEWLDNLADMPIYIIGQMATQRISCTVNALLSSAYLSCKNIDPAQSGGRPGFNLRINVYGPNVAWFLFALKITGNMQQNTRICKHCGELINNPRKGQFFHRGCRQAYYNKKRYDVRKLRKKGKSIEEIAAETGLEEEKVSHWVNNDTNKKK